MPVERLHAVARAASASNCTRTDISDWRITFVDTGLHSNIGQRLLRVRKHFEGEAVFLANYADGLSDLPLDRMIADFQAKQVVASFAAVNDLQSFHTVDATPDGYATRIDGMSNQELLINGGFFVLRHDIFDYIEEGDELVEAPFQRLIDKRAARGLSALRLLARDGHLQGQDHLRSHGGAGRLPLDGLEALRPRVLPLHARAASPASASTCCASARIATTSRSAAAARCWRCSSTTRACACTGWC